MSDEGGEYGPIRPGDASREELTEGETRELVEGLGEKVRRAHYEDAPRPDERWANETLCASCVHSPVCAVAQTEMLREQLVAITRCLAYIPGAE